MNLLKFVKEREIEFYLIYRQNMTIKVAIITQKIKKDKK